MTSPNGNRPRVVLAEDDDDLRGWLTSALAADGYDVVALRDGGELLDHLETGALQHRGPPETFIVDVNMPVCSGLSVVAHMRMSGLSSPVILMTAFGDASFEREARALDAVAMLSKPFDLDKLRDALARSTLELARAK